MKKSLSIFFAVIFILSLLTGCGGAPASEAESAAAAPAGSGQEVPSAAETPEPPPETPEAPEEAPSAQEPDSAEALPAAPTGAVIPAEECQAQGYDVRYGMFDFETYMELPLTDGPASLSYWFMIQPFMMGYNNVTENDFTYFKEMEARTGVHLELKAVSLFSAAEQFALMVTSGDYTDLVEGALTNYSGGGTKAIEDGFLLDLMEYLDEMPNLDAWLHSDPQLFGRRANPEQRAALRAPVLRGRAECRPPAPGRLAGRSGAGPAGDL